MKWKKGGKKKTRIKKKGGGKNTVEGGKERERMGREIGGKEKKKRERRKGEKGKGKKIFRGRPGRCDLHDRRRPGRAAVGRRFCGRSMRAGADVLEVGVPFSIRLPRPGWVQRATERALAAGGQSRRRWRMIAGIRHASPHQSRVQLREPAAAHGSGCVTKRRRRGSGRRADARFAIEELACFRETLAAAGSTRFSC